MPFSIIGWRWESNHKLLLPSATLVVVRPGAALLGINLKMLELLGEINLKTQVLLGLPRNWS